MAALLALLLCAVGELSAQGTAFIYNGQLTQSGLPVTGPRDLRFGLYDAATAGNQLATQTVPGVQVVLGNFNVTLDLGNAGFNGEARWLQISVKNNSGQYVPLLPRQKFMPTPYAIMANSSSNLLGTLPAGQITGSLPATQISGQLPASQLSGTLDSTLLNGTYSSPLNFNNAGNTFSGNGAGLSSVDAATLNGHNAGNFWKLGGNAGATPDSKFLGTVDGQAFELKVNSGRALRLEPTTNGSPNILGGAPGNFVGMIFGGGPGGSGIVATGTYGATISGGGSNSAFGTNSIYANYGTIGGGAANTVGRNGSYSTISGGSSNQMAWSFGPTPETTYSSIGGGSMNKVHTQSGVIGGGVKNEIGNLGSFPFEVAQTIGGGMRNAIGYEVSGGCTISGGMDNFMDENYGTIAGGISNRIDWVGGSSGNVIGGGKGNVMATGFFPFNGARGHSVIGGGFFNRIESSFASIPGGLSNYVGGHFALAGGRRAKAGHQGAFVWADGTDKDFLSTAENSFSVRSVGGARFVTAVDGTGDPIAGVELPAGGGSWSTLSDRNAKENLTQVDSRDVLERVSRMPISIWNYKSQDAAIRHIGPMAQDFATAFQVGENDRRISTVDADGVALAAIQGLNEKLQEAVKSKDAEIQELKQRLEKLEELIKGKIGANQ